jgi:hypothetical protein
MWFFVESGSLYGQRPGWYLELSEDLFLLHTCLFTFANHLTIRRWDTFKFTSNNVKSLKTISDNAGFWNLQVNILLDVLNGLY